MYPKQCSDTNKVSSQVPGRTGSSQMNVIKTERTVPVKKHQNNTSFMLSYK